jgi:hypothetical protein
VLAPGLAQPRIDLGFRREPIGQLVSAAKAAPLGTEIRRIGDHPFALRLTHFLYSPHRHNCLAHATLLRPTSIGDSLRACVGAI